VEFYFAQLYSTEYGLVKAENKCGILAHNLL